jgi:uncharacterized protein (DUF1015 family)
VADLRAFHALAYERSVVGDLAGVVAPPYDVIPAERLPELKARSPYNVVHLTRPGSDYEGAAELERRWISDGVLKRELNPAMYLHEVEFDGRRRRDLVAALRLQPYADGVVLPHERTHRGPKEDRLALLRTTRTSLEPLWFLYDAAGTDLSQLLAQGFAGEALAMFTDEDAASHRLWRVNDDEWTDRVKEAFSSLPVLIADGHHRYETALSYSEEVGGPADASSRFTLALLTDLADPGLEVLPTHRVLKAGVAITGGEPVGSLAEMLQALNGNAAAGYYRERMFHVLHFEGQVAAVELHRQVIDNILGKRSLEENVEYTRDPAEAVRWVDEGRGAAAFFLAPPNLSAVLNEARAGRTMPQKTTYFFPKPPSGMLFLQSAPDRGL